MDYGRYAYPSGGADGRSLLSPVKIDTTTTESGNRKVPEHIRPWSRLAEAIIKNAIANGAVRWLEDEREWAETLCCLAGIRYHVLVMAVKARNERRKRRGRHDIDS